MISKKSKEKIGKAFEELDSALEKFRLEVAHAGITGFKVGEINDIYEVAKLYSKVLEVKNKVNKIRPTVNTYVLDLVVEDLVTNNKKESQDKLVVSVDDDTDETVELTDKIMVENDINIRRNNGDLPVFVNISDGKKIHASARILSDKKVIISVGSVISDIEDDTISKTNTARRQKMILKKQLIPLESGGLKLTEDIKVDSLQMATNIIYGSTVKGVDRLWKTINGVTLRDYLSK